MNGSRGRSNGAAAAGLGEALAVLARSLEPSLSAAVIARITDGRIEYVNESFVQISGYEKHEVLGHTIHEFGRMPEAMELDLFHCLLVGKPWRGEFAATRKTGETYWVSTCISPLRDPSGNSTHVLTISQDITHLKAATTGSARDQAAVQDAPPDYVLVVDLEGTLLFVNGVAPGLRREDAIGRNVKEFVPPEYQAQLEAHIAEAIATGEPVRYEIEAIGAYGTTSRYVTRVSPIKRRGRVVALTFATINIGERDWVRAVLGTGELRASAERYGLLNEAGAEAIAVHTDGWILDANPAFARMYGYEVDEVVGMHALEFAPPEDRDAVRRNIQMRYEGTYEAHGRRRDGSIFPVWMQSKNVASNGRLLRITSFEAISRPRSNGTKAGSNNDREAEWPLELSRREIQVLELLAQGLTNREAAEQLRLSQRTIDHHVSHILTKLDVPNRTAAVFLANQAGCFDTSMR